MNIFYVDDALMGVCVDKHRAMAIGLAAVSAFLIDMIGDGGVAFDECNEFVGDVDGVAF